MSREDEIRTIRLQKKQKLEEAGMNPYPAQAKQDFTLAEVQKNFAKIKKEKTGKKISLVGRVMSKRGAGKISFIELFDGTGRFQAVLRVDELKKDKMKNFSKNFDIGDFIEVRGELFKTKTGEKSLKVFGYKMLSKSLLPLPEKWHGLQDTDERYRKRYLDVLMDSDVYSRFQLRSKVVKEIRAFLDEKDFLEIETPILQNQAGGAMAEVFKTHHNDLDMPMVLRIALELPHKMLMAGGYPAIYEIGKNFRNEGSDPTHIQEFTMLEWYAAYRTLDDNIRWTELMIKRCAKLTGKTEFAIPDATGKVTKVSFAGKWPRKTFAELVKKNAKLDIHTATRKEIEATAKEWGMAPAEIKKTGDANLLDFIYKKSSRNKIVQPTFVTHYPSDLKPLAQQNENKTAEVAQLVIAGAEVTNQYAELIDPVVQRALFEKQAEFKAGGDAEAMDIDEDFLTAMEHGMPPMTGFGLGIDRLVSILSEQYNLRDTIFFPIVKPEGKALSKKEAEARYRSKKIIVIADPKQGYGVTANALGQLGIAIGGFSSTDMFDATALPDRDGVRHYPDSLYPMANLAGNQKVMAEFYTKCVKAGIEVFDFSDIMRKAHTDQQMLDAYKQTKTKDVGYIAVGAVVPADFEKEWLSKLKLFS